MAFMKLRCDRAYATGAITTNLTPRELAMKLRRHGIGAMVSDGALHLDLAGDAYVFDNWEQNGLARIGWLRFKTDGDVGTLSRRLAIHGVRHRFEHSRPRDLDCDDVRCVTSYEFRWTGFDNTQGDTMPVILTYDEPVDAAQRSTAP
jgi:hypothetical protein